MKNKKTFYALIIAIMVMVLGVGYAVVSSVDLDVTGTASTKTTDLDIVISAATPNDTSKNVYGTVSNPVDLHATIHVANMETVGEKQTITYTLSNREKDVDALVTVDSILPNGNEYFKVTTSIPSSGIVVAANSTNTFEVTVELTKMPIEDADSEVDITVNLVAEAQAKA